MAYKTVLLSEVVQAVEYARLLHMHSPWMSWKLCTLTMEDVAGPKILHVIES